MSRRAQSETGRSTRAARTRRAKVQPPAHDPARPPADPRFFETDLEAWAGKGVARSGRKDAVLGRVERLQLHDERSLEARVRGTRPAPHRVQVFIDDTGITSRCDCPEPPGTPCRHAVAAVEALRFPLQHVAEGNRRGAPRAKRGQGKIVRPAQADAFLVVGGDQERNLTREERLELAEQDETRARTQRAKRGRWAVTQINDPTGPPTFRVADREEGPRTVVLRGPKGLRPRCDCRDFLENELGTCRHVERVRTWYLRKPKHYPERLVSVAWMPRSWTESQVDPSQEFFVDRHNVEVRDLSRWFADDGWIRPAPEGWAAAAWVVAAVTAAAWAAEAAGVPFDLDPIVWRRVAALQRIGPPARLSAATVDAVWEGLDRDLNMTLHPYQREGARFLVEAGRAFLADDMGLGKTVQAIAAAEALTRRGQVRRTLIICPASLKHQWKREIAKALGRDAEVVEGRKSLRDAAYARWTHGFLIVNYELVLRDVEALRAAAPDLVVLDEAQRIKNWGTKTSQAVKQLRARYKFILTGTPLENRLLELHSLVEFIRPRALGPRWRMLPYHAVTADGGRVVAYEGLKLLRHRLEPFFIRRERSQVLDQLPDRTDNTFWTGMTTVQKRLYRRHAQQLAKLVSGQQPLRTHEVRLLLQCLDAHAHRLQRRRAARLERIRAAAGGSGPAVGRRDQGALFTQTGRVRPGAGGPAGSLVGEDRRLQPVGAGAAAGALRRARGRWHPAG